MSAAKTGTPLRAELLGEQLQGLGLAGAGGAGDQAVPVDHAERDPDADVGEVVRAGHQPAQLQGRTLEGVAGADRGDDGVLCGRLAHAGSPAERERSEWSVGVFTRSP